MMKKNRFYGMMLLSAVALMLAGCQADVLQGGSPGEVPVTLTTAVQTNNLSATRAATDVLSATQFGASETFYAYFPTGVRIGEATSACGTTFNTNGSGGTTPATQPYFNATATSANVCAYYGKSGGASGAQVTNATTAFTVATDQSQTEAGTAGYKASDLMYATASVTKSGTSSSGSLTFGHKMSKIIVNVTLGAGISKVTGVRIVGGSKTIAIANSATTDEASAAYLGSVSTADADQISADDGKFIAFYSGEYTSTTAALTCAGLIPPQTVGATAETAFLQVVTAEGTATYSVTNKAFASGQSYTYNITITAAAIGLTTAITAWDDSEDAIALANNGGSTLIEGPKAIDIGLFVGGDESGTPLLWANMNVGATSETDYGLYFAWGDIVGRSGDHTEGTANDNYNYDWVNYKWANGDYNKMIKYCPTDKTDYWDGSGSPDNKLVLDAADDAATANWGGSWRMPTQAELEALANTRNTNEFGDNNGTHWKWTWYADYNGSGHAGYLISYRASLDNTTVTSTLFLPAAGFRSLTYVDYQGLGGYCFWSSTLHSGYPNNACLLYFDSSLAVVSFQQRFYGYTVRPVYDDRIPPALGDPYYSDGTWGNNPHAANAEVIGIVAWLGSDSDLKCGKSHGLVMAKSDVSSTQEWGGYGSDESFLTNTSTITIDGCRSNDKNGLTNTTKLNGGTGGCSHGHAAASAAASYTPAAPTSNGATSWFLPSAAQWLAVLGPDGIGKQTTAEQVCSWYDSDHTAYNNIKNALVASGVGGTALQYSSYWSSSEAYDAGAVPVAFDSSTGVFVGDCYKYYTFYVRPFLAF